MVRARLSRGPSFDRTVEWRDCSVRFGRPRQSLRLEPLPRQTTTRCSTSSKLHRQPLAQRRQRRRPRCALRSLRLVHVRCILLLAARSDTHGDRRGELNDRCMFCVVRVERCMPLVCLQLEAARTGAAKAAAEVCCDRSLLRVGICMLLVCLLFAARSGSHRGSIAARSGSHKGGKGGGRGVLRSVIAARWKLHAALCVHCLQLEAARTEAALQREAARTEAAKAAAEVCYDRSMLHVGSCMLLCVFVVCSSQRHAHQRQRRRPRWPQCKHG